MPMPSCQTILIRSPLAPLNTYKSPACGSRPNTCCTCNASPFMPFRMSVRPTASHTRTPDGTGIIAAPAPLQPPQPAQPGSKPVSASGLCTQNPPDHRRGATPGIVPGLRISVSWRCNHHLRKPVTSAAKLLSPAVDLAWADLRPARHFGDNRSRLQGLGDNRLLLLVGPATPPLGAGDHLNSRHRTASNTGASTVACTDA